MWSLIVNIFLPFFHELIVFDHNFLNSTIHRRYSTKSTLFLYTVIHTVVGEKKRSFYHERVKKQNRRYRTLYCTPVDKERKKGKNVQILKEAEKENKEEEMQNSRKKWRII